MFADEIKKATKPPSIPIKVFNVELLLSNLI